MPAGAWHLSQEGLAHLASVRDPTKGAFGSGRHRQCTATARSTGLRCGGVAVKGRRTCRVHGGFSGRGKRRPLDGKSLVKRDRILRYAHRRQVAAEIETLPSALRPYMPEAARQVHAIAPELGCDGLAQLYATVQTAAAIAGRIGYGELQERMSFARWLVPPGRLLGLYPTPEERQ